MLFRITQLYTGKSLNKTSFLGFWGLVGFFVCLVVSGSCFGIGGGCLFVLRFSWVFSDFYFWSVFAKQFNVGKDLSKNIHTLRTWEKKRKYFWTIFLGA